MATKKVAKKAVKKVAKEEVIETVPAPVVVEEPPVPTPAPKTEEFELVTTAMVPLAKDSGVESIGGFAGKTGALADLFDKFQKLSYLVDVSISMDSQMKGSPKDQIGAYKWENNLVDRIKKELISAAQDMCQGEGLSDEEAVEAVYMLPGLEKETIQVWAIEHQNDLSTQFNITLERDFNVPLAPTKLAAVKNAAKGFVNRRFSKYPESDVLVYGFNTTTVQHVQGRGEQCVIDGINALYPNGGTEIYQAVEKVLRDFKRAPSQVMAHHIVLITDGEDGGAVAIETGLLPRMKELNVVFDFIYIKSEHNYSDNRVIDSLRRVCEATHGEYQEVTTVGDFNEKFLAASERPMLGYRG